MSSRTTSSSSPAGNREPSVRPRRWSSRPMPGGMPRSVPLPGPAATSRANPRKTPPRRAQSSPTHGPGGSVRYPDGTIIIQNQQKLVYSAGTATPGWWIPRSPPRPRRMDPPRERQFLAPRQRQTRPGRARGCRPRARSRAPSHSPASRSFGVTMSSICCARRITCRRPGMPIRLSVRTR